MPDRFRAHRETLAKAIGDAAIAIVPASSEVTRNNDVHHEFRQDSDFFYLTGFPEPDAVAVIAPGHPAGDYHLFVRPRDRDREIWDGYRAGTEGAMARFQADVAYELSELDSALPRLMLGRDTMFYRLGNPSHDERIGRLLATARGYRERFGRSAPTAVSDVSALLAEQRMIKSPAELDSLRAACELSAEGHREAMRFALPGLAEYQVQAAMEFLWREGGSPRNGYPSIVASGQNAVVLHYTENDAMIDDGDLVLIDAACEIDLYSSDITRTFPANGAFTASQRALYDVVLAAQQAAIGAVRPGETLKAVGDLSRQILAEGMVDLGLIPASVEDVLAMNLEREFFMHGTSHWLGLDVHDAGAYRLQGEHRPLAPGMCFTVEPGIYVNADRPTVEFTMHAYDFAAHIERQVVEGPAAAKKALQADLEAAPKISHELPAEFLGLGIRIEDDIVVTADGHENLTSMVPVDPDEVEALCAEPSWLHRA